MEHGIYFYTCGAKEEESNEGDFYGHWVEVQKELTRELTVFTHWWGNQSL